MFIFLKPGLIWKLTEEWKSYRADEPSEFYLKATKIGLSNRTIPAEKCANGNIRILRKDLTATVGNVMEFGAAARYNL